MISAHVVVIPTRPPSPHPIGVTMSQPCITERASVTREVGGEHQGLG